MLACVKISAEGAPPSTDSSEVQSLALGQLAGQVWHLWGVCLGYGVWDHRPCPRTDPLRNRTQKHLLMRPVLMSQLPSVPPSLLGLAVVSWLVFCPLYVVSDPITELLSLRFQLKK